MAVERTFSIIKPDAVAARVTGEIVSRFEKAGLRVVGSRMMKLTQAQAEGFYAEHKGKPFYEGLVQYMTSGPVIVQVLEGESAITLNRELMGATDPKEAAPGTIRADFAESKQQNAVHGSDSPVSARREIGYFFTDQQIFSD